MFIMIVLCTYSVLVLVLYRRVFNWFAYIVLLYNITAGLVSSTLRVVGSALIGLLAMFRMDRILFIKGFEWMDIGKGGGGDGRVGRAVVTMILPKKITIAILLPP